MAINSLPGVTGAGAPVAEAVPGERKAGAAVTTDPAFAAMLLGLLGVPAPATTATAAAPTTPAAPTGSTISLATGTSAAPDAPDAAQPTADGQAPGQAAQAIPQVLPPAVERFLQAQRVQTSASVTPVTGAVQPPPKAVTPEQVPQSLTLPTPAPIPVASESVPIVQLVMEAQARVAPLTSEEPESAPPVDLTATPEVALESVLVAFAPTPTGEVAPQNGPARTEGLPPIPSPIDPQQLMEHVAKAATTGKDGQYTVTLRLHPEQLGEVRLQLHLNGSEVRTTMEVANPAARQALEQSSDVLRQGLGQAGLTLSGFQVTTGQGERKREQDWPEDTRPDRRRTPAAEASRTAVAPAPGLRRPAGTGFDTLA